jgi:hypothetical protein
MIAGSKKRMNEAKMVENTNRLALSVFINMQAIPLHRRLFLAWRLIWQIDLKKYRELKQEH